MRPRLRPRPAFAFFFERIKDDLHLRCLQDMSRERVPDDGKSADPRGICLPAPYATVEEGMLGEPCTIADESAKQCRAYLTEHRKLPRHKVPKVGMRADGMVAIRYCAARQATMEREEAKIKSSPELTKMLDRDVRERAAAAWKEACDFNAPARAQCDADAAADVLAVRTAMREYYQNVHCLCAQKKQCRGQFCICPCYFCGTDRVHAAAGNRCKCSTPHREAKRWCGATVAALAQDATAPDQTKVDIYAGFSLDINEEVAAASAGAALLEDKVKRDAAKKQKEEEERKNTFRFMDTTNHTERPSRTCDCEARRLCAVVGCDCFCSYCIRYKAKMVNASATSDAMYCPCWNSDTCVGAETCSCACYKCAMEKTLMGYCPFQPPIGLR